MSEPLHLRVDMTPPRDLTPNASKNRWAKTASRNEFKAAGAVSAINALRGHEWCVEGLVTVDVVIYWQRGRRTLDFDNAVASCKHVIDSIFEKIGMNDNKIVGMTVKQKRDVMGAGYMELTISEYREEMTA